MREAKHVLTAVQREAQDKRRVSCFLYKCLDLTAEGS
jgi:hypothetical protein